MYTNIELIIVAVILLVLGAIFYLRRKGKFIESLEGGVVGGVGGVGGRVATIHYAHWCHHCKDMMGKHGAWTQLKHYVEKNGSGDVLVEHDEVKTPTPSITSFPTIVLTVDGVKTTYKGDRSFKSIKQFVIG